MRLAQYRSAAIELAGVAKVYGGVAAVDGVEAWLKGHLRSA